MSIENSSPVPSPSEISSPPSPPALPSNLNHQSPTQSPPDGGIEAWLQVFGAFMVFWNIWGLPMSFGAFQSFYVLQYLPDYSSSAISWIGTLQGALLIMLGVVSGPVYDLGHYHFLVYTGSFLTIFGMMMLSLSTQYYQVFLSQGVCTGVGCGLLYVPTMSLVGGSFKHKRAIAMSVMTSGTALGGIIYTIIFSRLISQIGFPWTVRIIAFVSFSTFAMALPALFIRPAKVSGRTRSLFDKTVFTDVPFLTFASAQFFIFLGYLVPLFYIPTYAQIALKENKSVALYILIGCQAASLFGRLFASVPAHHFGVMFTWVTCCSVSSILCFVWIATNTLAGFIVFSVLYGFFGGALIALPPSIFPVLCPDPGTLGSRMGLSWTTSALSFLIGTPVAGAIINLQTANFLGVQAWSGATLMVGTVLLLALWIMLSRSEGRIFI
ncbi:MFS transporter, MCP family, solute carrier family 16, member 10 [Mollisia scopiformis]|uniref:MFS transporter, MCP family, solute carrier family 16, member 10 n=1 Tax=Mollisia scopiformis TaxID=149040 RepID=A0A194XL38_MOLSC|nr:MFS transporter, MCP family, solute carrier family 16, member 10 [Mollisia scopiformis]KUJ20846.1 MFS transporter, MCP family, solute carrier family 16, member 10 [Mollisia scopiformis]